MGSTDGLDSGANEYVGGAVETHAAGSHTSGTTRNDPGH